MASYSVSLVRRIPASGTAPTFTELGPIKWTSLTVTHECGASGSLAAVAEVFSLEQSLRDPLMDLSVAPCEVWCYRTDDDGTALIFAGHLSGYRIQGTTIQFAGVGLLAYLQAMVRTTDYAVTATEQATIVKALIDTYQAQTYGNFGLDTSTLAATGVTRDLTLKGSDLAALDRVITEMGARDNGFDLEVDPSTRAMTLSSPRKGSDLSASIIIDGRSIGDPQYAQFVTLGQVASDVAVTSSSAGGVNLTSSAGDSGVRTSFGRAMMTSAFQDVSVQATLDDHATRFLADNDTPLHQITPGLLSVPGFSYGDFDTGDIIAYEYDAGLGLQTFTPRVKTISVTMDSGTERLAVGFY